MQSQIHEGYEYQDYFTVSIILQLMLKQTDAEITIDRKNFNRDKFDDLKVKTSNGITEFQIKYSDDETSHELTKDDFANGNGHDTALSDLFLSWKDSKKTEKDTRIKLCLAWNRPTDKHIAKFLKPVQDKSLPFSTVAFVFDGTHIKAEDLKYTLGEWGEYRVPFLFASNGRSYIEQLRIKSGIWFLDARSSENQPYPMIMR